MNKYILGAFLLVFLFSVSQAGHIFTWDADIFFQNSNNARRITLFFSLESGLPRNQRIRVRFPEAGTDVTSASLSAIGGNIPNTGEIGTSTTSGEVFVLTNMDLVAFDWYQLTLYFSSTFIAAQSAGYKGIISIDTSSSNSANRIIYDSNPVAAVYQLATKPTETLVVEVRYPVAVTNSQRQTLNQNYDIYFDITPKVSVKGGSLLRVQIDGSNNWAFGTSCASEARLCGDEAGCVNITQIQSTCVVASKELTLTANADIVVDTPVRIKTTVTNPTILQSSTGVTVFSISKVSNLIFERRSTTGTFSVVGITPGTPTVKYLWGITSFTSAKTRCTLGFFKRVPSSGTDYSPVSGGAVEVFNDLTLEFTTPSSTPSGQNLRVLIATPSAEFSIIDGSMRTNLPIVSGKTKIEYQSGDNRIAISPVAPLQSSSTYTFSAKIALTSAFTATSAFAITFQTVTTVDNADSFVTLGTGSPATFVLQQNYEYLDYGGSATAGIHRAGPTGVTGRVSGYSFVFANPTSADETIDAAWIKKTYVNSETNYGYSGVPLATSSTAIRELVINIALTDKKQLCGQTGLTGCDLSFDAATWSPAVYLSLVVNTNILKLDDSATFNGVHFYGTFWGGCDSRLTAAICVDNGAVADATNTFHASIRNAWDTTETTTGVGYLVATCIPNAKSSAGTAVAIACSIPSDAALATSFSAIGIRKKSSDTSIYKSGSEKVSQLYGGQQVLDIVICLGYNIIADATSTRPTTIDTFTIGSQSLLNVYVINSEQQPNVKVRFLNYLHSTGANVDAAPIFLRISGSLTLTNSGLSTLNVFLDRSLDISNAQNCVSSTSGVTCRSFSPSLIQVGNPVLGQRVDVVASIASAGALEFFIPVKSRVATETALNFGSFFIDLGVSSADDTYLSVKEIYRIYGFLWGAAKLFSPASGAGGLTASSVTYTQISSSLGPSGSCVIPAASGTDYRGFDNSIADWQAGKTFESGVNIRSNPTAACLGTYAGANAVAGGVGFVASSWVSSGPFQYDFVGSAAVKWSHTTAVTCYKFTFTSAVGFVCGLNSISASTDNIGADTNVEVKPFTVPWRWGASFSRANIGTSFSWSGGAVGYLLGYGTQVANPSTSFQSGCTLGEWGTVFKNSRQQRLTLTFTPSAGIQLSGTASIALATSITGATTGMTLASCSVELSSGTAGSCSISGTYTFSFSRASPATTSLEKQPQKIILLISQTTDIWTTATYTADLSYNGVKIDSCASQKAVTYSSNDDFGTLTISGLNLQLTKSSRTSFSFAFGVSNTQRQLWQGSTLDFNLGWLSDKLSEVASNLHCFIRAGSGNSVSFLWDNLNLVTVASPKVDTAVDVPLGTYTFVCHGAKAPSLSVTTRMNFAWKRNSDVLGSLTEENGVAALTTLGDAQAVLVASVTKSWNTQGMDASYRFLITPKRANYTLSSRIYVDFTIDIAPRGNRAGVPSCEINSTRVFCEWAPQQERRLVVWPVTPLTALSVQLPYELIIHGITQPAVLITYKNIGVTLDLDSDPTNGVSEWAEVLDTNPITTTTILPLLISEYSNSNPNTRTNTEIKINLNIPKDTIVKDSRVYVEFPSIFDDSLLLISSVTCNLYRISDLTAANLVQNCTLIRNRRVRIFTNADSGNTVDNIYVLTLSGIPTPAKPTINAPNWVTVFIAGANEDSVTHRTVPGYINASRVIYSHEANKQVPDWFFRNNVGGLSSVDGNLEVAIGTYRSDVILRSPTVADVSYNYALGGEFISNLAIWPSNLRVVFGERDSRFRVGAKANAIQGRYLVTTSKSNEQNGNKQIPIPTLPILVRNLTCSVNSNNDNIKVPAGGFSLPIIFDFADCMPVTDVQVDANFTDPDKYNISFGPEVSNTLASEKLVFESWNNTRVSFIVKSFNASQKAGLKTKIGFSLSGTNKDSYIAPRVVNVELVDNTAYNVAPTVTTLSASAVAGQVTLNLACSATGNLFFAIGTNPDIQTISVGTIKNATFARKLSLTPRDPMDPWWRVHGFISQAGTTAVSVVIPGVKSAALYYAVAYCQNQMDIPSSNNLKTSWNQTDNGGRVAKATLVFNATLTQDQQKDIACALANLLKVPQNTVMTQDGVFCSTLRRLQTSNSSNSSNSTNSTPVVQQNVSYSWFVLPDYAGVSSTIHTNLQSQMVAGFTDKLFALTTGKANTFPMVRSFSFFAPSSAIAAPPSTNEINPTINIFETFVTFDIILSNSSGYVYWGIGANSSSKPVGRVLRDKVDANGVALIAADRKYVPARTTVSFNATSSLVRNDTDYKLFIALSSDDPGPEASFSDVVEKQFRTKRPNFSSRTLFGSLLGLLLLVVSVFVL
jgi:hypothetical protein